MNGPLQCMYSWVRPLHVIIFSGVWAWLMIDKVRRRSVSKGSKFSCNVSSESVCAIHSSIISLIQVTLSFRIEHAVCTLLPCCMYLESNSTSECCSLKTQECPARWWTCIAKWNWTLHTAANPGPDSCLHHHIVAKCHLIAKQNWF